MVLVKGADERGFAFFTNYESRKGRELADNPHAALLFHWQPLGRQVRVEGGVERVDAAESEAYFRTRPLGSRLAAWASPQSRPLADRAELERLYADAVERFGEDVPLPPTGAASGSSPTSTSSGSTATTACTTASATSATQPAGRERAWLPSRA